MHDYFGDNLVSEIELMEGGGFPRLTYAQLIQGVRRALESSRHEVGRVEHGRWNPQCRYLGIYPFRKVPLPPNAGPPDPRAGFLPPPEPAEPPPPEPWYYLLVQHTPAAMRFYSGYAVDEYLFFPEMNYNIRMSYWYMLGRLLERWMRVAWNHHKLILDRVKQLDLTFIDGPGTSHRLIKMVKKGVFAGSGIREVASVGIASVAQTKAKLLKHLTKYPIHRQPIRHKRMNEILRG